MITAQKIIVWEDPMLDADTKPRAPQPPSPARRTRPRTARALGIDRRHRRGLGRPRWRGATGS